CIDRNPSATLTGPHAWACTSRGEVWHAARNFRAWARQRPPTIAANNATGQALALLSIASAGSTVYAVGHGGLIIKSTNFGSTWKVISYTKEKASDVFAAGDISGTPED